MLLSVNTGNRQIRRKNVNYWKHCLAGDAVTLTHQGVAITGTLSNPQRLIDGQHRLLAILETGIPCQLVVAENAPPESFMNLDNGMVRSLGDRADITSKEATMANIFYYILANRTERPPVKLIREINDIISPYACLVADDRKRAISLASIRAAFVVQQKVRGFNQSQEFQQGCFSSLPESLNALYRRQSTNPLGLGGGNAGSVAFCATWRAITRPSISRIYSSTNSSEEARNIASNAFPEIVSVMGNYKS